MRNIEYTKLDLANARRAMQTHERERGTAKKEESDFLICMLLFFLCVLLPWVPYFLKNTLAGCGIYDFIWSYHSIDCHLKYFE